MAFKRFALLLVLINVIIFIFQTLYLNITDEFALVSAEFQSKPWTLVTYMFLHANVEHILFNMIALALFGSILEYTIGSKRFLLLYFASGIVAGLFSLFFYQASIGASGAIFGVIGALGVLKPRMTVYIAYVPMPMALAVIVWAALNFAGLFVPDETAYASHIGGLIFGLAYGGYLKKEFKEESKKRKIEKMGDKDINEWENVYMKNQR